MLGDTGYRSNIQCKVMDLVLMSLPSEADNNYA